MDQPMGVYELFVKRSAAPAPSSELFAWHERPGAFERLSPPWDEVQVLKRTGGIRDGDIVALRIRLGPIPIRWVIRHDGYIPGRRFQDVQVSGPFRSWKHTHSMEPNGPCDSWLEDRIEYRLPFGALGRLLGAAASRKQLESLFAYRHATTVDDLREHMKYTDRPRLRVAISGTHGLVGGALAAFLTTGGHEVVRLTRSLEAGDATSVFWDSQGGVQNREALEGLDAVIHLAGESIAGRWSESVMRAIQESRERGTRTLAETLAGLNRPPRTMITASAIGYYGDRGEEILDESSASGRLFLSDVCRRWESAAAPAREAGIRVVHARFGVVLSPRGGALKNMLPLFRLGLGGPLGTGRQYMSWISIDDAVGALHHLLMNDLEGPVNLTAPVAVTNHEFTRSLGRILRRPAFLPVPGFAMRLAFGRMADELLLAGARAVPVRLQESGYRFRHPEIEGALAHILGRQGHQESDGGTNEIGAS